MIVVIPTIWESPYLGGLLEVLDKDSDTVEKVVLVNNWEGPLLHGTKDDKVATVMAKMHDNGKVLSLRTPGLSIYAAWNIGIQMGDSEDEYVACLNDDIILTPGSLAAAAAVFSRPAPEGKEWGLVGLNYFEPNAPVSTIAPVKEVVGTHRLSGFGGFAFVLPPDSPYADEEYKWWYGDDDLGEKIKATGRRLGVAMGAPVAHPFPGTSISKHPRTQAHYEHDLARYRRVWQGAP